MAVASFRRNGQIVAMKGFHPPAKATVTHWYKAATSQIDCAPDWRDVNMGRALIDENTIVFTGGDWDLFIARRRDLR